MCGVKNYRMLLQQRKINGLNMILHFLLGSMSGRVSVHTHIKNNLLHSYGTDDE